VVAFGLSSSASIVAVHRVGHTAV